MAVDFTQLIAAYFAKISRLASETGDTCGGVSCRAAGNFGGGAHHRIKMFGAVFIDQIH